MLDRILKQPYIKWKVAVTAIISLLFILLSFAALSNGIVSLDFTSGQKPNIIMVSLTTLRPDHMPCYGYKRNTSPFICDFGEENILFEQAISQGAWTLPSQASTFTSQYQMVHGVKKSHDRLQEDSRTLAEILKSNDYNTAAFVGSDFRGHFRKDFNLDQGFEIYRIPGRNIDETTSEAVRYLDKGKISKPFFMFVHGYDIHDYGMKNRSDIFDKKYDGKLDDKMFGPYSIRKKEGNFTYRNLKQEVKKLSKRDFKHVKSTYDTNIRYSDKAVKQFFSDLKEKGVYENSLIVIYSGHGTNLNDKLVEGNRVTGHSHLYDFNIHTPLMIKMPKSFEDTERRVKEQVEHIDLIPTILDVLGIKKHSKIQGESFLPLIKGEETNKTDYAFSQTESRSAVRTQEWKLIMSNQDINNNFSEIEGQLIRVGSPNYTDYFENRPEKARQLKQKLSEWKRNNYELRSNSKTSQKSRRFTK